MGEMAATMGSATENRVPAKLEITNLDMLALQMGHLDQREIRVRPRRRAKMESGGSCRSLRQMALRFPSTPPQFDLASRLERLLQSGASLFLPARK